MSISSNELAEYQTQMKKLELQKDLTLKKWLSSDDPNLLMKAHLHLEDVEKRQTSGLKTLIFDPETRNQGDGYLRKNVSLTFGTLRTMSRTPIISSIIKTRVEQVSEFTVPQPGKFQPGFVIRKKRKSYFREDEAKLTKDEEKRIDEMTEFLLNCGEDSNKWHGDSLDGFTRKLIPDSLSMDQATFEVVRNRRGVPIEFMATDAATMRISESYEDDEYMQRDLEKINGYLPSYVQVIDGRVRNQYYPWELCFGVRNPNTNIYNNNYGTSELEELMNIVTWMLNSDTYNGKFFSQGSAFKGIMKVSGNVNTTRLNEFRQSWQATTAGVSNAHKIPVVESDSMEFIDLQKNNKDMEFSEWQEYLIKVCCALYKIDPSEVFDLRHTNAGKLGGDSKEENIKYSKDKGLKPLLKAYQAWLNKYIVNPRDSDLELVFIGLDIESEERELELDIKRAASFMGYKEIRDKYDLGELAEDDVILNPTYVQYLQNQMNGGTDSNEAVTQFDDGNFGGPGAEVEKGEESNPFVEELNKFTQRVLMK